MGESLPGIADVERMLVELRDDEIVASIPVDHDHASAELLTLWTAAAANTQDHESAVELAKEIVSASRAAVDQIYFAGWILIAYSDGDTAGLRRLERDAPDSAPRAFLELKHHLIRRDPSGLDRVAQHLDTLGHGRLAALATAESFFIREDWPAAAEAYEAVDIDRPDLMTFRERQAWAMFETRRRDAAVALLRQLPIHSKTGREMLELGRAARYAARRRIRSALLDDISRVGRVL